MIKKILYIFIAVAVLSSCSKDTPITPENQDLKTFLSKSVEGAYVSGVSAIVLDNAVHQIAKNPTALTYRIQNDAQTVFFHTKLSSKPTAEQQKITVTINARGVSGIANSYEMSLEKSSDGKMWLWDNASATGIIIAL